MIDERRLEEIRRNAQPLTAPDRGYYGLPLLKPPVWSWEVPAYFFVGGTAGASAVIAFAAQVSGADRDLVRHARWIAAAGAALSAPLLISDLGRPERFLNMLRVFKPQSAMSVGAWTLAIFGAASSVAAIAKRGIVGDAAAALASASGMVMATYTGVLIGATSIPAWSKHASILPLHFAASAAASASSLLQLLGHDERALQMIAFGAAAFESYARFRLDRSANTTTMRVAEFFSGPLQLILRLLGSRSRRARTAASASALLGSMITRIAWIEAGRASAETKEPSSTLGSSG